MKESGPHLATYSLRSNISVHFIFRHKNPLTGEWEEKHLKNPPTPKIGKATALYTLIVKYVTVQPASIFMGLSRNADPALRFISPDNTYEVLVNDESVKSGSLLEDFDPPVNPSKDIFDPTDSKPADWVDESQIVDTSATKVSHKRVY